MKHLTIQTCALAAAVTSAATAQTWTQQSPANMPGERGFASIAVDRAGDVLVFGGWQTLSFADYNDLWLWNGTDWTLQTPATTTPPGRWSAALSVDTGTDNAILFGGIPFPPQANFGYVETWSWDGSDWTMRDPGTSPGNTSPLGVYAPGMAYDSRRQRTVVFGGRSPGSVSTADTWEWNDAASTWTKINVNGPSPRYDAGMAYDGARGVIVLFGGFDGNTLFGDTWEYDGTNWTQVMTDNTPPVRGAGNLTYDSNRQSMILHGGYQGSTFFNDTWEFDGSDWYRLYPNTAPPTGAAENQGRVAAFHANSSSVVAFGAYTNNRTWTYGGNASRMSTYGRGCGNAISSPLLAPTTAPAAGQTFTLDVTGLGNATPASMIVTFWLGRRLDLSPFGALGCTLYSNPTNSFAVPLAANGGTATFQASIPAGAFGTLFECQAVQIEPTANALAVTLSDAVRCVPR